MLEYGVRWWYYFVNYFRYLDADPTLELFEVPCSHKKGSFDCRDLPKDIIKLARQKFFANPDKVKQDNVLSHLIDLELPKRKEVENRMPKSTINFK